MLGNSASFWLDGELVSQRELGIEANEPEASAPGEFVARRPLRAVTLPPWGKSERQWRGHGRDRFHLGGR